MGSQPLRIRRDPTTRPNCRLYDSQDPRMRVKHNITPEENASSSLNDIAFDRLRDKKLPANRAPSLAINLSETVVVSTEQTPLHQEYPL